MDQEHNPPAGGRYLRDPETGDLIPIDEDGNPIDPAE